jgi:hypothetical protein
VAAEAGRGLRDVGESRPAPGRGRDDPPPARFDDEIAVETTLALVRAASFRFDFRLVRVADGVLVAEASTLLACVTIEGAVRRMTPEVAEVLGRSEAANAQTDSSWIDPSP